MHHLGLPKDETISTLYVVVWVILWLRQTSEIISINLERFGQSQLYRGSTALSSSLPQGRLQKWLLRSPLVSWLWMATDSVWNGVIPGSQRKEKEKDGTTGSDQARGCSRTAKNSSSSSHSKEKPLSTTLTYFQVVLQQWWTLPCSCPRFWATHIPSNGTTSPFMKAPGWIHCSSQDPQGWELMPQNIAASSILSPHEYWNKYNFLSLVVSIVAECVRSEQLQNDSLASLHIFRGSLDPK